MIPGFRFMCLRIVRFDPNSGFEGTQGVLALDRASIPLGPESKGLLREV